MTYFASLFDLVEKTFKMQLFLSAVKSSKRTYLIVPCLYAVVNKRLKNNPKIFDVHKATELSFLY